MTPLSTCQHTQKLVCCLFVSFFLNLFLNKENKFELLPGSHGLFANTQFSFSHTKKQTSSLSVIQWAVGDVRVCQHSQDQMIAQQEEATGKPMILTVTSKCVSTC